MSLKRIVITIVFVYFLGFLAHAAIVGKTVYGDGAYYYSWLRSLAIDHDLDFRNDYRLFDITQKTTEVGLIGNIYPIGPALYWWPTFIALDVAVRGRGGSLPYQLAIGIVGVWAAIVGLLFMYRVLRRFFPEAMALTTLVAIAFATNLWFYGSLDTVNSHALSFFLASAFLMLFLTPKRSHIALGVLLGSLALVRPQDAVYGVLLLHGANIKSLSKNAIGFLFTFSVQLLAWQVVYGKFWVSPYLDRGYGFDFLHPKILETLFSSNNGLFLWTPITLLGCIGLFLKNFPKPELRPYFIGIVCIQIYLVASWTTWWQGASFSGRMFISILPILAIGLAQFFTSVTNNVLDVRKLLTTYVLPLSLLNGMLIFMYLLSH